MKKQRLTYIRVCLLVGLFISLRSMAQVVEHAPIARTDTIISIAQVNGQSQLWDFSSLNFNAYPNTTDSDLVNIIDPALVYSNSNLNALNDSITESLTEKLYVEKDIEMRRRGNYSMKIEGSGTLKTGGMFQTNIKKVKLVERCFCILRKDTGLQYVNTYYLFFKEDTKELLLSVFNKKRTLMPFYGSEFNGVAYHKPAPLLNSRDQNPLQLVLSPNPAATQTELSYTLINHAHVTIELSNLTNTVNTVIYNGDKRAGINHTSIALKAYPTGLYVVKVTVSGNVYATTLIIN